MSYLIEAGHTPDREQRNEQARKLCADLVQDNRSPQAQANIAEYEQRKAENKLYFLSRCPDARSITPQPNKVLSYATIANGGRSERAARALTSNAVQFGVVAAHYDGDTFQIGQSPEGCGGRKAKRAQEASGKNYNDAEGLEGYVGQLAHSDVMIQACYVAATMASHAEGKPVAAMAQDHRTGEMRALAVFQQRGSRMLSDTAVSPALLFDNQYNPQRLYANGIPSIERDELPDAIQELLANYDRQLQTLHRENPTLIETQRVQNPKFIALSTDLRDAKVSLPGMVGRPNSIFRLTVPRFRIGSELQLTREDVAAAWAQAEYVISHSAQNHGQNKDFAGTDTFIINTRSYELSVTLAEDLLQQGYMRRWLELRGRSIIVAQTTGGEINRIGYMDYTIQQDGSINARAQAHLI